MSYKWNISDEKCILVQFSNENNELGIGFQDWLQCKNDEINADTIQSLIDNESETTILWPRCDVGPANITKKGTKDCEWNKVVVKILASGPWTVMCENQNSLIKYGIINPTRQDRRNLAKKQHDGDSDNIKQAATKKTLTSAPKNKKMSSNVDKSATFFAEYKSQQPKYDTIEESEEESEESVDDSSDDNFNMSKKSKNALLEKISDLTYQNKKLKEENVNLLALQNVSKIDSIITRVLKNVKTVDDITSKLVDNTLAQMRANVDEKSNVRHKQSSSTFSFGIKEIKTELLDIAQDETETNYHKAVECNKENILSASGSREYKNKIRTTARE
ncbi:uncharacterized protein LOC113005739 isoform X2 [Solenopsis invicta]|uniref:uncharacterized protein LOC113005739 isoform X2 n=1 Tax=Solenopsis invicta TaxID=13686 RepID=UPI00193D6336|nr:uncharacterized protein LOC113005739 isoform X2 [Solenopsis invicta]